MKCFQQMRGEVLHDGVMNFTGWRDLCYMPGDGSYLME